MPELYTDVFRVGANDIMPMCNQILKIAHFYRIKKERAATHFYPDSQTNATVHLLPLIAHTFHTRTAAFTLPPPQGTSKMIVKLILTY